MPKYVAPRREPAAAWALALEHQGLVIHVATRCRSLLPPTVELDDAIAHGQLGLLHAAARYDPDRGCRFGTYATRCIWGHIRAALARQWGQPPGGTRSLQAPIRSATRGGDVLLTDTLAARTATADELVGHRDLWDLVARLPPRLRYVVEQHIVADRTMAVIAAELGVTRARVDQLWRIACAQLKRWLKEGAPPMSPQKVEFHQTAPGSCPHCRGPLVREPALAAAGQTTDVLTCLLCGREYPCAAPSPRWPLPGRSRPMWSAARGADTAPPPPPGPRTRRDRPRPLDQPRRAAHPRREVDR